jgi:hypothetical protein
MSFSSILSAVIEPQFMHRKPSYIHADTSVEEP